VVFQVKGVVAAVQETTMMEAAEVVLVVLVAGHP
jgi:hypothetical protein